MSYMNPGTQVFRTAYKISVLATASLLLVLAGCAKNKNDVASYSVLLRLHAGANLNQGMYQQPLAQVIKVYHLRAVERFEQTPFDNLLNSAEEEKSLGSDLLDSRELLLVPGQHVETLESVSPEAKYLGVVAFFRQPAPQRWRLAYSTKDSEATGITVGIHACALSSTAGALVSKTSGAADSLVSVNCVEANSGR